MDKLDFKNNSLPTVGIELELALVDAETAALRSAIDRILEHTPRQFASRLKPELMQCCLEINTEICYTIGDAEADLREKIVAVEQVADQIGVALYWTGTHPFSCWQDQQLTPTERYERLIAILQDMGRQLITFGMHVHVGVDSGDKAVMICERLMRHLPALLALSCNSPWWNNRVSGLQSHRSKIMEALPTAGLPTLMRNWSEYVWLVNHLVDTGFINSIREIWWDVRPHHGFGTVEVRIFDMPGSLKDSLALAALVQCLVQALSDEIDHGTYQRDCHPMMVRQNKWRASRHGLDARLVDSFTHHQRPARDVVRDLVDELLPTADQFDCRRYLEQITTIATGPTWAERQLQLLQQTGDAASVVREMVRQSRISPLPDSSTTPPPPPSRGEMPPAEIA